MTLPALAGSAMKRFSARSLCEYLREKTALAFAAAAYRSLSHFCEPGRIKRPNNFAD